MVYSPKASSTPKTIRGRPPIRPQEMIQSPIEHSHSEKSSESERQSDEEEEIVEDNKSHQDESNSTKFYCNWYILYIVAVFAVICLALYCYEPEEQGVNGLISEFEILQKQFPSQEEDFWINLRVAVNDISALKQPKSIIFLYKNEKSVTDIINSISKYASSQLCHSSEPIKVPDNYFKKSEVLNDYGTFIADIKPKLNEHCVVITKNLDQIPGISAQAFHSLCDEYNPVEEKVLYIFTMKVDTFPTNSYKFVEKRLREVWSELHNDKFYPLFTRISTFILQVI